MITTPAETRVEAERTTKSKIHTPGGKLEGVGARFLRPVVCLEIILICFSFIGACLLVLNFYAEFIYIRAIFQNLSPTAGPVMNFNKLATRPGNN